MGEGLEQWFLTGEGLPLNDKKISGDSFGFHNWDQGEMLLAANRDAAKHPTTHRTIATTLSYLA